MARSGNYQITGNELQAMVNENLIGLRPGQTIPAINRCLTRAEVASKVYARTGPQDPYFPSIPSTSWDIGGGVFQFGPSPYLTCNWNYINPLPTQNSILFEMDQVGGVDYLNVDLFGQVNGSPLRLDPGNSPPLDGMFFGGPQYSPQMNANVWVGSTLSIQANFGRNTIETAPSNWGWQRDGYGFLEITANGTLIYNQSLWKPESHSANLASLSYTFTVQANTDYYIKAYSAIGYEYYQCYSSVSPSVACYAANNLNNGCDCCANNGSGC
jgi:hypothetical protein